MTLPEFQTIKGVYFGKEGTYNPEDGLGATMEHIHEDTKRYKQFEEAEESEGSDSPIVRFGDQKVVIIDIFISRERVHREGKGGLDVRYIVARPDET